MKPRKEAEELIKKQLHVSYEKPWEGHSRNKLGCDTWHYGKCELRELLNFIYGEEENG